MDDDHDDTLSLACITIQITDLNDAAFLVIELVFMRTSSSSVE